MKRINTELLNQVSAQAKTSSRLRMNYNFHKNPTDAVQRMLNAFEPGTYLRPHRHPDRDEVFLIFRGKMVLFLFDDQGNIIDTMLLCVDDGNYGAEIPPMTWHTLLILEPNTVMYELKEGPYIPLAEEHFASWSPEPEDVIAVLQYLTTLKKSVTL
jgi:cupin fold WbuC family metalloprotein